DRGPGRPDRLRRGSSEQPAGGPGAAAGRAGVRGRAVPARVRAGGARGRPARRSGARGRPARRSRARGSAEPVMTYTFGLDTFGAGKADAEAKRLSHAQTIRTVVDEGVFAEQAGVDFFGIGEHHTEYFPMPAGDLALAAIAARTERIRLGSAVTVLGS